MRWSRLPVALPPIDATGAGRLASPGVAGWLPPSCHGHLAWASPRPPVCATSWRSALLFAVTDSLAHVVPKEAKVLLLQAAREPRRGAARCHDGAVRGPVAPHGVNLCFLDCLISKRVLS